MARINPEKNSVLFKYNGSPAVANVVNIEENVLVSPDIKSQEYKEFDGQLGNTQSYFDEYHTTTTLSLKTKLRGNDKTSVAPETPPAISDLLKACGLTETIGADNVTYTPNHGTISPSTADVYVDGKKRSVTGIVGDLTIRGEAGLCATVEVSAQGYTSVAETTSANPDVSDDLDKEALMIMNKVSSISIDGGTYEVDSFEFRTNNNIIDIYAVSVAEYSRTDFDPKISLTLNRDSADAFWTNLNNQDDAVIEIVLGSGVGKTVTLTIDTARPLNISESKGDGKLSATLEYRCLKDATSGNHFELKFA
jgi:hypothetical protein